MERHLITELTNWKKSPNRKPLLLKGARQVGKTWLIKEFGRVAFKNVAYINFENSERLKMLFLLDFDIPRIITEIEIETKCKINPADTLLIFDEIQESTKGLTALKYFYENAPEYYIVAAGSLLGVALQKQNSFPVGKVDFLELYPMSFIEFLENIDEKLLAKQLIDNNWSVISGFHEKLISLLRIYYYVGGMPEVVADYVLNKDFLSLRKIQEKILVGYQNDFAKYAPNEIVPKIRMVWNALISQLSKENKKFIYGQIKKGSRAKDFEMAINWLQDAGLVTKVNRVNNPKIPLKSYIDYDAFKLFSLDVGLLNASGGIGASVLLEKNNILTEFKGAMTEQFVWQQLRLQYDLFYWSSEAEAEVDFLLQKDNQVVPVEVKAEENLKAKSLKVFVDKYSNTEAIRCSMSKYRSENWLTNIPLYAIGTYFNH